MRVFDYDLVPMGQNDQFMFGKDNEAGDLYFGISRACESSEGKKVDNFLHGFKLDAKESLEKRAASFFEKGVLLYRSNGCKIPSTAMLLPKNEDIMIRGANYNFAQYSVMISIPERMTLASGLTLHFGCASNEARNEIENQTAGRQNETYLPFDYYYMQAIPPEFIVGIIWKDQCNENETADCHMILNEGFYALRSENRDRLYERLNAAMADRTSRVLCGLDEGEISPTFVAFSEKNYPYISDFVEQRAKETNLNPIP